MNKYFLIENKYNRNKSPIYYDFVDNNINLTKEIKYADYFLVIGGDGSLLDAIQKYKKYNKPFIGIHTGSIGYYMHNFNNLNDILILNEKKLEVAKFPLLSFEANNDKGEIFKGEAFSDVWIERLVPQSLKYNICIKNLKNESNFCNINQKTIIGDGILFSTPAGSTGYTKNLGGNIIPFDVPVFQVVPMASAIEKKHMVSFPLGLDYNSVEIEFEDVDFRQGGLIYDGISAKNENKNEIFKPAKLKIIKSKNTVSLAFISLSDFRNKSFQWILE